MNQFTVLIGGTNGYGINDACILLCRLFGRLGYHVYGYNDFPSVIKGQHQYAVIRIASQRISTHTRMPDVVLALDQETIDTHRQDFLPDTFVLYDSDKANGTALEQPTLGIPLTQKVKEVRGTNEMRPTCLVAALCRQLGMKWSLIEEVIQKHHPNKGGLEMDLMRNIFNGTEQQGESMPIHATEVMKGAMEGIQKPQYPVLNGCQAISLGLLQSGLRAYVGYPMTPTSPILEYLAGLEKETGIQVVLPESEIAVIMTALGYSYMGVKNAIGTSGGGFSLMVEALGLSGMGELPVVVVMGQRAGPSTGMPTYTAQTDLMFVMHAGHGEFSRFVVAPGDAEEAYEWSAIAMEKAWKHRMPAIVLIDKTLGLGIYSFDKTRPGSIPEEISVDARHIPGRQKGLAVKANSYIHDEFGYARENPEIAKASADNLMQKELLLAKELKDLPQVKIYGEGETALLCWGSCKGVCVETADKLGLKVIQVLVMAPFPKEAVAGALQGVKNLISVECNAKGQLAMLMAQNGFPVNEKILKYDGRPFALEELEAEVKKVMK
jgi:2-oxoglutarate/2-oxoacid ferredoxin oxidoreductase subunit alpha